VQAQEGSAHEHVRAQLCLQVGPAVRQREWELFNISSVVPVKEAEVFIFGVTVLYQ
jgi:hypothetical protein